MVRISDDHFKTGIASSAYNDVPIFGFLIAALGRTDAPVAVSQGPRLAGRFSKAAIVSSISESAGSTAPAKFRTPANWARSNEAFVSKRACWNQAWRSKRVPSKRTGTKKWAEAGMILKAY